MYFSQHQKYHKQKVFFHGLCSILHSLLSLRDDVTVEGVDKRQTGE